MRKDGETYILAVSADATKSVAGTTGNVPGLDWGSLFRLILSCCAGIGLIVLSFLVIDWAFDGKGAKKSAGGSGK